MAERFTARELTQETMQKVGRVVEEAEEAAKQEASDQKLMPEGGVTTSTS
jgi:hypothetical protein